MGLSSTTASQKSRLLRLQVLDYHHHHIFTADYRRIQYVIEADILYIIFRH